jgi:hypothetical protein
VRVSSKNFDNALPKKHKNKIKKGRKENKKARRKESLHILTFNY